MADLLKYRPSQLSRFGLQYEREKEERAVNEKKLRHARIFHTASFFCALFALGILSLILPKPVESVVEKRTLAKMPEFSAEALFGGSYVKDIEMYYADTFPMRDGFVSFAAAADELRGIRFDGVRIYNQASEAPQQLPAKPETAADSPAAVKKQEPDPSPSSKLPAAAKSESSSKEASSSEASSRAPRVVEDDGALGERSGAVFVYKNKAMEMFGGSKEMGRVYAQTINSYDDAFDDSVRVFNMIIPTAIEFALPQRYQNVTNPQKPNIDDIYANLNPSILKVDAYSAIEDHADDYLYFNADHHWTGRGAYWAYTAFAQSAGFKPLELSAFEIRKLDEFYGTLHAATNDAKLKVDYVEYFIPKGIEATAVRFAAAAPYSPVEHSVWAEYASGGNSYGVFLGGDYPLIKINTSVKNGRSALVVKESYGNAFAPFLISHYEQVFVVDQRYFPFNLIEFVRQNGVQDVIFANNAFAANTGIRIQEIGSLKNGGYSPPAPPVKLVPQPLPPLLAESKPAQSGSKK
ncbi:hypothetical protein FACS1894191_3890 [Clostridia bacterium]|nr:hypothetical protein FACS1894191_3890 [Clostridia bacterium]